MQDNEIEMVEETMQKFHTQCGALEAYYIFIYELRYYEHYNMGNAPKQKYTFLMCVANIWSNFFVSIWKIFW